MRLLLAVAFALGLTSAVHAAPEKLWEVTGLDVPESVVFDPATNALYVSSIGAEIMAKDRNGFISKVSPDGKMLTREWVTGLNGPAGLAIANGKLYAGDIDELVEIDIASAKVLNRYKAEGGKFLNGVTADDAGRVYASDSLTNTIWRLQDGRFEPWVTSEDLNGPNGLVIDGDRLIVGSFGQLPEGDKPGKAGTLTAISLKDKSLKKLPGGPIGNLDGLTLLAPGQYLVTDWVKGGLYVVRVDLTVEQLIDLNPGSADLTYLPDKQTAIIPMMKDNALVAYKLD
jgi:sugar lactone lactonase YvrE